MENLKDTIKALRKTRGWTQGQLAIKSGLPRTTIVSLENRGASRPSAQTLSGLASAFRISVSELIGKTDVAVQTMAESPDDILERYRLAAPISIPVYDHFVIHAGTGAEAPSEYIYRPRSQAAPGNIEGYRVTGNCMEPEIPDGAIVTVDRDRVPQKGNIILCAVNGEVLIGRIIEQGGKLYLRNGHGDHLLEDCQAHAVVIDVTKRLV
ncbi:MAG: XRE family transcriptional regulator [Dehalogenimonas sp.]